jgi:hypothetical protein
MIGKIFPSHRKEQSPGEPKGAPQPTPRPDPAPRRSGERPEKAQDLLRGHDGERVGFRRPVEG